MYQPSVLARVLSENSEFTCRLIEVKCGDFCSCDRENRKLCFSGEAITIQSGTLVFTALWSKLPPPFPDECRQIYVVPPDGFNGALHGWFTAAQRMGGRSFGMGPDFVNLEPHDWPLYSEVFSGVFGEDFSPSAFSLPLPESISGYINEVEDLHASKQHPYVCPLCHDATCAATKNQESPCSYADEL